jgi:hypothetical protein
MVQFQHLMVQCIHLESRIVVLLHETWQWELRVLITYELILQVDALGLYE